jgi:hypothetical protein
MFKNTFLYLSPLLLSLTGCNSEPSANEVSIAVSEAFLHSTSFPENTLVGAIANAAGVEGISLDSLEKINCEPNGKNSFICEVSIEFSINNTKGSIVDLLGVAGSKRKIAKYRLVNTSKGWIASPLEN